MKPPRLYGTGKWERWERRRFRGDSWDAKERFGHKLGDYLWSYWTYQLTLRASAWMKADRGFVHLWFIALIANIATIVAWPIPTVGRVLVIALCAAILIYGISTKILSPAWGLFAFLLLLFMKGFIHETLMDEYEGEVEANESFFAYLMVIGLAFMVPAFIRDEDRVRKRILMVRDGRYELARRWENRPDEHEQRLFKKFKSAWMDRVLSDQDLSFESFLKKYESEISDYECEEDLKIAYNRSRCTKQ